MIGGKWTTKPTLGVPIDTSGPFFQGLTAVWPINEGTGSTLYNAVSPGLYNATLQTGAATPTWTGGRYGAGLQMLTASLQYATPGAVAALNGATAATLFVAGNRAASKIWVVGRPKATNTTFQMLFFTDNNIYCEIDTGAASAFGATTSGTAAPTGDFTAAMVYDGSQATNINRCFCYVNGVKTTITPISGTFPTSIPTSANTFQIGADVTQSRYSTGRFDFVALWTGRVLSALEIDILSANPWILWDQVALDWLEKSSGTSVLGTGAITFGGFSVAGSGSFSDIGTGAITLGSLAPVGSGTFSTTGTGAITLAALSPVGTGTLGAIGTGSITLGAMSPVGAGSFKVTGSGSIALAGLGVTGIGTAGNQGSGSITLGPLSPAGIGTFTASTALVSYVNPRAVARDATQEDAGFGALDPTAVSH